MAVIFGLLGLIVFFAFAISQFIAGYAGIEHELGTVWALIAVFAALIMRFTLPITIGAFFGAMNVWGWHWAVALIFSAPGLLLIIPGMLTSFLSTFRR